MTCVKTTCVDCDLRLYDSVIEKELKYNRKRVEELEFRIDRAKALVGHKSHDSRLRLMMILDGTD